MLKCDPATHMHVWNDGHSVPCECGKSTRTITGPGSAVTSVPIEITVSFDADYSDDSAVSRSRAPQALLDPEVLDTLERGRWGDIAREIAQIVALGMEPCDLDCLTEAEDAALRSLLATIRRTHPVHYEQTEAVASPPAPEGEKP